MDSTGIPFHLLVLAVVAIPVCLAVLIGMRVFQGMTPLAFRCRRCDREFLRRPHRRFPTACPLCRARDWNR
jgi:Zn finger protein HypA/HybF involved in hydrogenase expression